MRIGIDLDGTVVDTYGYWLQVLAQTPLAGRFTAIQLLDHHNDPDLFRYVEEHSDQMFGKPPAMPGALQTIRRLQAQGHELYFISARHQGLRAVTEQWLVQNGLPVDRLFLLTGGDKAALCHAEGIRLMFEDSPHYGPRLAASDIHVWLLDAEYNQEVRGANIRRFTHWSEVLTAGALQAPA